MGDGLKITDRITFGNNVFTPPTTSIDGVKNPIQIFPTMQSESDNQLVDFSFGKGNNASATEASELAPKIDIEALRANMFALQRQANNINSNIRTIEDRLAQKDKPLSLSEKRALEEKLKILKEEHKKAVEAFRQAWIKTSRAVAIQKKYIAPPRITESNSKIEDFRQGYTGDCWLLASLKSISDSPKGAELLKKIIQRNRDGSVTINLLGVNKQYTFTQKDINKRFAESKDKTDRSFLSTGDVDVFLIEMAVEKEIKEINGDYQERAMKILTGKNTTVIDAKTREVSNGVNRANDIHRKMWNLLDYALKNPKNLIMTFDTPSEKVSGSPLVKRHAYAIDTEKSTSNNIVLINPHDTSKRINVPKDKISQWGDNITITDLRDYKNYKMPEGSHLWGIRQTFNLHSIRSLILANPELNNIKTIPIGTIIRIPKEK